MCSFGFKGFNVADRLEKKYGDFHQIKFFCHT